VKEAFGRSERVVAPESSFADMQEAYAPKVREMARGPRLGHLQNVNHVADAELAAPARVSEFANACDRQMLERAGLLWLLPRFW
jgi:hypothetical protein